MPAKRGFFTKISDETSTDEGMITATHEHVIRTKPEEIENRTYRKKKIFKN